MPSEEFREKIVNSLFFRVGRELNKVKDEPRMVLLITHGFIELIVNAIVDARCKNAKQITDDTRSYSHSVKLILLNELGILSDHDFKLLNWFRKMRNKAAHEALFELQPPMLDNFANPDHRDPAKFDSLCRSVIISLFFEHEQIVGPKFIEGVYEEVETEILMIDEPAPEEFIPLKDDPKRVSRPASEPKKVRRPLPEGMASVLNYGNDVTSDSK